MFKRIKRCGVSFLSVFAVIAVAVAFMATNASAQDYPPGMVSYWKFDEGSGNIAYDSVDGNHGTIYGGATWISGKVGGALSFDGVDDYVDLGNWFNLQTFTIEMWVNAGANQGTFADIIDNNHTDYRSWTVQYHKTSSYYHWGAADYQVVPDPTDVVNFTLTPGRWQHLVVTRDTYGVSSVYLDGVLIGSRSMTNSIRYDGTEFLRLARWGGGGRNWNGQLDEVRIYNRALSKSEILELYGIKPQATPTLDGNNQLGLDGSGTISENPIQTYEWYLDNKDALGNDFTLFGQIVSLNNVDVGCYNATLTVTDSSNLSSTDSIEVCVPSCIPVETDNDGDGYSVEEGDCDDSNLSINPGATEVCDGIDNNCNDQIDEDFDSDEDGFTVCGGDCDDSDFLINPNVVELPGNTIDENCDGSLGNCDPNSSWKNRGEYVRCVADEVKELVDSGIITEDEGNELVNAAAQSDVGKKQ